MFITLEVKTGQTRTISYLLIHKKQAEVEKEERGRLSGHFTTWGTGNEVLGMAGDTNATLSQKRIPSYSPALRPLLTHSGHWLARGKDLI